MLACFLRGNYWPYGRARFDVDDKPVPVSVMILASQLVIALSDDVLKFDIARGWRWTVPPPSISTPA
jgi:hypothetical protein